MSGLSEVTSSTPLVLADGTVIDPDTGKKKLADYLVVPNNQEAVKEIASKYIIKSVAPKS